MRHGIAFVLLLLGAASAAPASAEMLARGQGQTLGLACGGQDARVSGNANSVTFTGTCQTLRIEGDHNVVGVTLAPSGTVRISGSYNQVVYVPGAPPPVTTLRGYYNQVVPGPVVARSDTLLLDGSFDRHDVACGGLDVVIRDSEARYVLRGGCRSLTIEGRGLTIAAELLPAARLVIGGAGVVVNYVLTAQGAPPTVIVTDPAARATHVARFGEDALMLPTSAGPR